MTRPPRPKYPSDQKNYHEIRRPGCAHTIRLSEELLETYVALKRALGPTASHADVIRFLFESAESAISAVLQAAEPVIHVLDSQALESTIDLDVQEETTILGEDDPDAESGGDVSAVEDSEDDGIICLDSQIPVSSKNDASRTFPFARFGLWSKPKVLEFFLKLTVLCPSEGCMRKVLPPQVCEFQQLWSIRVKCPVEHTYTFLTGELERDRGTPQVSSHIYNAALCAGMTHSCLESLCEQVGLYVPRKAHFFDFQAGKRKPPGWVRTALDLWDEHKTKLQDALLRARRPVAVYVDCRFDSSRSGYHGTLPVINIEDDKVIEMITLTRKQTGSSWKIESAALEEALQKLEQKGLQISEVIHDDNATVDAILAQHNIMSQKDLWHKCKNLMAKFKDVLQDKRRSPSDTTVEGATTIAGVAVFSMQQLKDFCRVNGLPTAGNKLQLVQRVSVHLQLPEAGANTEIQRTRPLRYPELQQHDLAYKVKSWIYTCCKNAAKRGDTDSKVLTKDIHNAADHWCGNHSTCRTLPGTRKCVSENWPDGRDSKYAEGGETHKAVKDFMKKYIIEAKMKFYIRARENYMSETFHSVINKYATKRIHFDASHHARLACAALDWNENIRREVRAIHDRTCNDTAVRRRARTNRILVARTALWKQQLAARLNK